MALMYPSAMRSTGDQLERHRLRICEDIGGGKNGNGLETQVSRICREIADDKEDTEVSSTHARKQ